MPHGEYPNAVGTTSACAENTYHHSAIGGELGNYLRVRGEYQSRHLGYSRA